MLFVVVIQEGTITIILNRILTKLFCIWTLEDVVHFQLKSIIATGFPGESSCKKHKTALSIRYIRSSGIITENILWDHHAAVIIMDYH